MAADTLTLAADPANSEPSLYDLASAIQSHAHRIISLAQVIDAALDDCSCDDPARGPVGRAIDCIHLLKEEAEKAMSAGEQVEIRSIRARLAS